MTRYNYKEAVKDDLRKVIIDIINYSDYSDVDELRDYWLDEAWVDDAITGNASGSYTFSTWKAEEYLCHNLDLLGEALVEFGYDASYLITNGAEACDVLIRCYLLSQCIDEVLEEIKDEFSEAHEEEEVE